MTATHNIMRSLELATELRRERQAYRAVDSLAEFTKMMWPVIEPGTPLLWNWHLDIVLNALEAVMRGEHNELVIAIPPGSMKSIAVSVMGPCFWWLRKPHLRGLFISNSDRLCVRDSRRARDIIQSKEYARCRAIACAKYKIPDWSIASDQAEKVHFATTEHGARLAIPSSARVTGDRADFIVIDDAVDAQESVIGTPEQVVHRMEEVRDKYDHVWASRLNDPKSNPRITIAQRLAPDDLPGVLIKRGVPNVVLPMEFEPESPYRHPDDPRTEHGELLFPDRFPAEYVAKLKSTPGASRHYRAQYQQDPPPLGGGAFRKEWFRYYTDENDHYSLMQSGGIVKRAMKTDCWRLMVSDTALSTRTMADFSVIQVWDILRHEHRGVGEEGEVSHHTSDAILIDQWRGQVTAPEYQDMLEVLRHRYKPMFVAIEDSTASRAIIDRLKRDGIVVKPLPPREYGGDKVNRAYAASILMESGKIWFPTSAPWLVDLESELLNFPGGKNDDQADTLAWAIICVADRDLWTKPKPTPLPPNSYGKILGHDKIFRPKKKSVFQLDAR